MNAAFATRLPLKMFHRVGHVTLFPIDARVSEGAIEQLSRWSHKGSARQILLITRLLADESDGRISRAPRQEL